MVGSKHHSGLLKLTADCSPGAENVRITFGRRKQEIRKSLTFAHYAINSGTWGVGSGGREMGFPGGASGKETTSQGRRQKRRGFNPWVRKIPWRRAGQPTPVFLPG